MADKVSLGSGAWTGVFSRSDQYRRLSIEARGRSAQAKEPELKRSFEDVADHWLALAEQAEWLDEQHTNRGPQAGPSQSASMQQQQQIQPKTKDD
jgi:hypothetical protein